MRYFPRYDNRARKLTEFSIDTSKPENQHIGMKGDDLMTRLRPEVQDWLRTNVTDMHTVHCTGGDHIYVRFWSDRDAALFQTFFG